MATLREIAAQYAVAQPQQVDDITVNAPVLDIAQFYPTNKGLHHAYEKIESIGEAALVAMDAPLPSADVTTALKTEDLGIMGFKIEAPVDKLADLYGRGTDAFASYLADRSPLIIRKSAMSVESQVIALMVAYAKEVGNIVSAGGSGQGHAIIMARFTQDNFCGLYDPNGFGQGAMFDTLIRCGGGTYERKADGVICYGADFKSYLDFLLDNPKCIGAIVNIDDTHKPTADMIEDMLADAHAGEDGVTRIITHPKSMKYIRAIKGNALSMTVNDTNISRAVGSWDQVPITTSYNQGTNGLFANVVLA
ncbi:hypothetical protein [uncultured Sphaerochaeta sp.]|uniref:hypothetical protein n=1 Tax=uncultured Sphaerochaeta sp. TaxID=886478 RepID=UPI002A0A40A6|nr:hypothetical protein [uncultured Sphaerochaeta sp.]